ncbi:MFS transporter [Gallaecimonas mangrovi]|uniref:MFS transporter n=1 Tax=Gallaecimonas mangrovi TaxID=2291597 RepID=UPI000E1FF155|nr:MFS transporter [Gallaecimonas mangrovi]
MVNRLTSLPLLVWVTLLGALLVQGTFFMVWPFLSILLYQRFALGPYQIGVILSVAALAGSLLGFYVSALSDRFGRKHIMLASGLCCALAFVVMAMADSVHGYVLGILLVSIGRSIFGPATQALMIDQLPEKPRRELALQLRYFVANMAGAAGPLVGVWVGLTAKQSTFFITAATYLLLLAMLLWAMKRGYRLADNTLGNQGFRRTLMLLGQDHGFLLLVLANILLMFVYAHIDSSLIQYLTRAHVPALVKLISQLILVNTLTIICLQFPLRHLLGRWAISTQMQLGVVLITVAQLWYAFNPMSWHLGWLGATFVLSVGEVILFPNISVQIDDMAPPGLKGAYFGAGNLYAIGWSLSPLIGGWMLEHYSGRILYLWLALVSIAVLVLYAMASKVPRPSWLKTEAKL